MGVMNCVTCRKCGYHAETREGFGMGGALLMLNLKERLRSGEIDNPEALELLEDHRLIFGYSAYLCTECKEFRTVELPVGVENIETLPYGRARCDYVFPFGKPHCEKCGKEMVYINCVKK